MIPNFTSLKRNFWEFFNRSFLDLVFPPLCRFCKEPVRDIFCASCWELCSLSDPTDRCRTCFSPIHPKQELCPDCLKSPLIPAVSGFVFEKGSFAHLLGVNKPLGLAAFSYIQWFRLGWLDPDCIVPMPGKGVLEIAESLSKYFNVPSVRALNRHCEYMEDRLEEGQIILLIDVRSSFENLKKGAYSLRESLPQKVYLLRLYP